MAGCTLGREDPHHGRDRPGREAGREGARGRQRGVGARALRQRRRAQGARGRRGQDRGRRPRAGRLLRGAAGRHHLRAALRRAPARASGAPTSTPTSAASLSFMELCQNAKAFLHCSSTAVYQPNGDHAPFKETDPLGDNHRVMRRSSPTCRPTASPRSRAEGAARWGARRFELPTTIARLNVPYGDKVRLAGVPPRHDGRAGSRCRCTSTGPPSTTRSTTTTSSRGARDARDRVGSGRPR